MSTQSYANHRRFVPGYHYLLSLLLLLLLGGAGYSVFASLRRADGRLDSLLLLGLTVTAVLLAWYVRLFALKAQDRAIRAEESLRHYVLTGRLLDPRLTIAQIVALRFAVDAELPELARRAAEEGLSNDAVKRSIRSWRADLWRV